MLFSRIRKAQILSAKPVSEKFGYDRGTPIDRHYIERFIGSHASDIRGTVLEIGAPLYTRKFGSNSVQSLILTQDESSVAGAIRARLDEPAGLTPVADCFICTQTFNFIYNLQSAAEGAYKVLNSGGVMLATVAALAPVSAYDAERWGDYWRFTPQSARKLFDGVFGPDKVAVTVYGNSASAALFIKGYACEDLPSGFKLDYCDPNFPVVIGIRAKK